MLNFQIKVAGEQKFYFLFVQINSVRKQGEANQI